MEAVLGEEEEVAVAEMGLRGRRPPPRQPSGLKTTTTTHISKVEVSNQDLESSSSILFGNDRGKEGVHGGSAGAKDDNIILQSSNKTMAMKEQQTSSNATTTQDQTELYLDHVYNKPVSHEFFCPNCNSCIKKVIVREWQTDSPPTYEPVDTFRCSSCFSFLIPAGNWFSRNFAPNEEERRNEQETNMQDPSIMENSPLLGTIPLKPKSKPYEQLKDQTSYHPSPKPDSAEKEQAEIGSFDAIKDAKYSEKIGTDERSTIQAYGKEIVKTGKTDLGRVEIGVPVNTSISIEEVDEVRQTLLPSEDRKLEILKSIVYGGLTESITSLSVVTSAASADATTLNIIALALANLVGGLFIIAHQLKELKNEQSGENSVRTNERVDHYQELLGQKQNFIIHATVVILSFITFGLVPPLVYGFTFLKSDNKYYKLAAVAAASLLSITILAIAKAYVRKLPKSYIKTVMYYVVAGIAASGVSYLAGEIIRKLIEKFGWFDSEAPVTGIIDKSYRMTQFASY